MIQMCTEVFRLALTGGTPARSAWVAAVVGSILVLINQWEAFVALAPLSLPKLVLTYVVPYLVSTYTSVSKDLKGQDTDC